jgi:hypothetical protein
VLDPATYPYAQIDTPNSGVKDVVFESRGSDALEPTLHSFADDNEDTLSVPGGQAFDGACEVCHTQADHHRNTGDPDPHHAIGRTCTDCHAHDTGFAPTGGSCTECHATVQDDGDNNPVGGRRAVVGEFALPSHHISDANLQDSDCEVCHDQSTHQLDQVRLFEVDGGTSILLAGDPMSNSVEAAKLTAFCVACHDADGAGGDTAPFSGGAVRPEIDVTAWSAGSHLGGSIGCFGDGSSFGCHASGHGSEKRKLLSTYDVAPVPPANAEEEEGFCFNCHDADGPATSDVHALFANPINWTNEDVGDLSNWNLNDRHDVQYEAQLVSGAKIECTDCHDPHAASATNPLKADPDPSDGRLPGSGAIEAGADFQTEWCLDCHDGSFPPSIVAPTTAITDVRTTRLTDAMGLGGIVRRRGSRGAQHAPCNHHARRTNTHSGHR